MTDAITQVLDQLVETGELESQTIMCPRREYRLPGMTRWNSKEEIALELLKTFLRAPVPKEPGPF